MKAWFFAVLLTTEILADGECMHREGEDHQHGLQVVKLIIGNYKFASSKIPHNKICASATDEEGCSLVSVCEWLLSQPLLG